LPTQAAIDLIPKDIIVCGWHYGKRESYPLVPSLLEKGFRVVPTSRDSYIGAASKKSHATNRRPLLQRHERRTSLLPHSPSPCPPAKLPHRFVIGVGEWMAQDRILRIVAQNCILLYRGFAIRRL